MRTALVHGIMMAWLQIPPEVQMAAFEAWIIGREISREPCKEKIDSASVRTWIFIPSEFLTE
jgi:hypothetical protein